MAIMQCCRRITRRCCCGDQGADRRRIQAGAPGLLPDSRSRPATGEIDNDTVGALAKRIDAMKFRPRHTHPGGHQYPGRQNRLAAGSRKDLARNGIGVVVKEGAAKPDISTDEAFKKALLAESSPISIRPLEDRANLRGTHAREAGIAAEMKARADSFRRRGSRTYRQGRGRARHSSDSEILPVKASHW
jgi:hypothetical protein